MEPRKYQFNNSTMTIVFGDILDANGTDTDMYPQINGGDIT